MVIENLKQNLDSYSKSTQTIILEQCKKQGISIIDTDTEQNPKKEISKKSEEPVTQEDVSEIF
jgi:hypothetical protein